MKPTANFQTTARYVDALRKRRAQFSKLIGNGMGIVTSHVVPKAFERFGYRQGSHFYYLTGMPESDAVAVFTPAHPKEKCVLFLRERDPKTELWNGPMVGLEGAVNALGFDAAYPLGQLAEKFPQLAMHADSFYWNNAPSEFFYHELSQLVYGSKERRNGAPVISDVANLIGDLRLIKDDIELDNLQHANDISSRAHEAAMRRAAPGVFEYQIQATLEGAMIEHGSLRRGYGSIVAAGSNACCLHYTLSTSKVDDGDLVLVDAGTEWDGYTADITRTFPANKKFSAEQRAIYEAVLDVQKKIIDMVKPGVRYQSLNARTIELISEWLIQLKLVNVTNVREVIDKELFRDFYPHGVSHWLGLDVHDVGRYKIANQDRMLEPNMCFTVEPGIYIQADNMKVDARWRGIGVRIEDDVCVTSKGVRNFTTCIKEIADIENRT